MSTKGDARRHIPLRKKYATPAARSCITEATAKGKRAQSMMLLESVCIYICGPKTYTFLKRKHMLQVYKSWGIDLCHEEIVATSLETMQIFYGCRLAYTSHRSAMWVCDSYVGSVTNVQHSHDTSHEDYCSGFQLFIWIEDFCLSSG